MDMDTFRSIQREIEMAEARLAAADPQIELLPNCGRYLAQDNTGQWYYLNHAHEWQTCPPPLDGKAASENAAFWQNFADKFDVILVSFEENGAFFKITDTDSSNHITRALAEKMFNFKPKTTDGISPLKLGDRVRLWSSPVISGTVIGRDSNDYYLVRWDTDTTKQVQHHRHDLVKLAFSVERNYPDNNPPVGMPHIIEILNEHIFSGMKILLGAISSEINQREKVLGVLSNFILNDSKTTLDDIKNLEEKSINAGFTLEQVGQWSANVKRLDNNSEV